MKTLTFGAALAILLCGPRPALAQRVDLGGNVSSIVFLGEGRAPLTAGPAVTLHFTGKHALEAIGDLDHYTYGPHTGLIVIYILQYRRTFQARDSRFAAFVTAGGAGAAEWSHHKEQTFTRTQGIVNGKWTDIEPAVETIRARSEFWVYPPIMATFGGGVEYGLNRRFALRGDATLGISPFGGTAVRGGIGGVVRLGSVAAAK